MLLLRLQVWKIKFSTDYQGETDRLAGRDRVKVLPVPVPWLYDINIVDTPGTNALKSVSVRSVEVLCILWLL